MLHKDSPHLFQVDIYALALFLYEVICVLTLLNMNDVDVLGEYGGRYQHYLKPRPLTVLKLNSGNYYAILFSSEEILYRHEL